MVRLKFRAMGANIRMTVRPINVARIEYLKGFIDAITRVFRTIVFNS